MSGEEKIEKKWYWKLPRHLIPIIGMAAGILLLLCGSLYTGNDGEDNSEYMVRYYTEELEERITALCTSISGITEASVLLTLENGSEYVYAQNQEADGRAWDYVIVNRGEQEEAVLVTEIFPQVRGVAVVCTGGDTASVQQTIVNLLSASLGISSNRIHVAGS